MTEAQKYAQGATKPGGVAEGGFFEDGAAPQTIQTAVGTEHLSKAPPWACSICKVSCTSEATLLAHATGAKHKRRARAAASVKSKGEIAQPDVSAAAHATLVGAQALGSAAAPEPSTSEVGHSDASLGAQRACSCRMLHVSLHRAAHQPS